MTKRKHKGGQHQPSLKKMRTEIMNFSLNKSLGSDSSVSQSLDNPSRKTQSRKEKRKEERLLKKARKQAFSQRKAIPTKHDLLLAKEEIAMEEQKDVQMKRKKAAKKKEEKEKKKRKERRKKKLEEKKQYEKEEIDAVQQRDNQEIHDLEKKLHLHKRKSKTLPQSFLDDGLDYILDVVNAEKLEAMANEDMESDIEGDFAVKDDMQSDDQFNEDLDEIESDLDAEDVEDDDMVAEDENMEEDSDIDSEHTDFNKEGNKRTADRSDKPEDRNVVDGIKEAKWEKLAEKIQKVVGKCGTESKSIMKQKDVESAHQKAVDVSESSVSKVKKKVSFADETVGKSADSEESSVVENTDSDSLSSGEYNDSLSSGESIDMNDMSETPLEQDDDFDGSVNSNKSELKEDIYGRLRDAEGNIVKDNKGVGGASGAYIPPAKRAQIIAGTDEKRKAHLEKLKKQMKGLVNRASEANIHSVSSQIEELYLSNSRADVNETFVGLVFDLCITTEITPERLSMELMMLVAILQGNVGSEVGAHFLQNLVKRLDVYLKAESPSLSKEIDNVVILISHLYNFKVVHSVLMFDVLKLLTERFQEKDIEIILTIVKNIGFSLRKDDPTGLKELIVSIQTKASSPEVTALKDQSRIRFMLDILMAIRNNNMRKIPNYDPEHLQHLQKMMKGLLRGGDFGDNQLHVTLQDLINAENKGKWWIVGSAWEGQGPKQPLKENRDQMSSVLHGIEISSKLQQLAKKQRMNTDKRRTIFYVIMTSEDYIDAFEKLLRMGLKSSQQQEIVIVILDCCLQEKTYNPFYAFLAQKFCNHHRSYQMSFQFSIWDRFKEINDLSDTNRHNFGKLLTHLFIHKSLSLSVLKVVEFGTVQKSMVRLLKQVLSELLLDHPQDKMEAAFARIAPLVKLKKLHEGLKLFMHHFLIGKRKDSADVNPLLKERIGIVDEILSVSKGHML